LNAPGRWTSIFTSPPYCSFWPLSSTCSVVTSAVIVNADRARSASPILLSAARASASGLVAGAAFAWA
jgi:hypothetical protein